MRLKLYRAPSVAAAMTMVRIDLGPDALILASRAVAGGVEVTAALEPAADAIPPLADPARAAALAWHGVPASLATMLAAGSLDGALEQRLGFGTLDLARGDAPLVLAGPPGAGKTVTTARLATRLVMAGQAPLVITADGRRAGAAEQLAAFTRLLGLTLLVASEPAALAQAVARRQDGAPVLIDTPGLDSFNPADMQELTGMAAAASATMALVMPAGLDPAEASDIAKGFAQAGATMLIATRLDLSRRLGGVLAAASCGLALTEAGIGPGAADGLCPLTPAFLAGRLLAAYSGRPGSVSPPRVSPILDAVS